MFLISKIISSWSKTIHFSKYDTSRKSCTFHNPIHKYVKKDSQSFFFFHLPSSSCFSLPSQSPMQLSEQNNGFLKMKFDLNDIFFEVVNFQLWEKYSNDQGKINFWKLDFFLPQTVGFKMHNLGRIVKYFLYSELSEFFKSMDCVKFCKKMYRRHHISRRFFTFTVLWKVQLFLETFLEKWIFLDQDKMILKFKNF